MQCSIQSHPLSRLSQRSTRQNSSRLIVLQQTPRNALWPLHCGEDFRLFNFRSWTSQPRVLLLTETSIFRVLRLASIRTVYRSMIHDKTCTPSTLWHGCMSRSDAGRSCRASLTYDNRLGPG